MMLLITCRFLPRCTLADRPSSHREDESLPMILEQLQGNPALSQASMSPQRGLPWIITPGEVQGPAQHDKPRHAHRDPGQV